MANERTPLLKSGETEPIPSEVVIAPGKSAPEEKSPVVSVNDLFHFHDGTDVFLMILGTLGAILYGALTPAQYIVMGKLTDDFVEFAQCIKDNCTPVPDLEDSMTKVAGWYVGIAFANLLFAWMALGLWGLTAERQVHRMRLALFRNIINQEIGWFDTHPSGELNTRLTEDLNKTADGMGSKFGRFVSCFFTFLCGYAIGFGYCWQMTLVMMTMLPMVMISGGIIAQITGGFTEKELSAYAKAGNVAEQSISSIRTVAAFGGEEKQGEKYEEHLDEACGFGIKKGFSIGLGMCVFQLVLFGNYALSFWYGIKLVRDRDAKPGDIITVFFAVFTGSMVLGQAAPSGEALAAARGAAYNIFQMIDRKSEIDPSSSDGDKPANIKGDVDFSNIDFVYPSREEIQILKDFNLKIPSGKRVALVGESGCGKSTVVKLIQRFYDPRGGSVMVDGQDIKSLNVSHLRRFIGVVNQEPVLFATTIAENIAFGREGATQREIEEAAKMANAHNFITSFPKGYETLCGERGTQMSGGQKQRIAIARALIRNPKILLLDEATSALDTESEAVVQEALDRAGEGRTTIIIAHRLSTIRNADIIVAVKEGQVAEMGSHDELMDLNGIYKTLVKLQELEVDEEEESDESDNEELLESYKLSEKEKLTTVDSHDTTITGTSKVSQGDDETQGKLNFSRLLKLNSPEWRYLLLGCFGSLIYGAYPFLFGICFGGIFETLSYNPGKPEEKEEMKDDAKKWAVVWIIIGVESGVGVLLQNWMFARSGEALTRRLRKKAFLALLRQDIAYFDLPRHSTGALCSRLATEVSSIKGATGSQLGLAVSGVVTVIGSLIVSFANSWQVTLVILAFVPLLYIAGLLTNSVLGSKTRTSDEAEAGHIAEEAISNIQTVTSLGLQETIFENYRNVIAEPYRRAKKVVHFAGISTGSAMCLVNLSFAATFRYGGKLVTDRDITLREMMTSIFTVSLGALVIGQLASMTPDYSKAKDAAKRLFLLLDNVPSIDSYSSAGLRPDECKGGIKLVNVRFRYPTRRRIKVLRNLDITVQPGQTVALVGTSGCGKSTSVSLVERFYDVKSGSVMIDGNNVKTLNVKWLRRQIGIVSQEPVLFDLTIRENIAYGDTTRDFSDKEIEEAARSANIHQFISNLPKGYDTVVGDKGTLISGGQKQRIAIARALIRSPKILLLDEATSALDTESEKAVQQALDKASIGRTTLMIAHRLSTIQHADLIVVIRKGRVVEQGNHQQLMAMKGIYYSLHKAQTMAVKQS